MSKRPGEREVKKGEKKNWKLAPAMPGHSIAISAAFLIPLDEGCFQGGFSPFGYSLLYGPVRSKWGIGQVNF